MKLENFNCIDDNINLDEYITFRENVKKSMEHPEWLGDFSEEDLRTLLYMGAKIWLYKYKSDLICSMMSIPANKKDIEKFGLTLDANEVLDYGPMMVNPEYIGKGLQLQMLKELDKYAIYNNYKYSCTTIHPNNIHSINNIILDGFDFITEKEFSRGVRNVYIKKLVNK